MNDNKLDDRALGHVMRFINNDGDAREQVTDIEVSDRTDTEIELAYTLGRDRYYVRLRRDDMARFMEVQP